MADRTKAKMLAESLEWWINNTDMPAESDAARAADELRRLDAVEAECDALRAEVERLRAVNAVSLAAMEDIRAAMYTNDHGTWSLAAQLSGQRAGRRHRRRQEQDMTRDDIIRMARESGFQTAAVDLMDGAGTWPLVRPHGEACLVDLERFAELVAAAEREECAKVCEAISAGMYNCDANGSPSDQYVAKWRVLDAIRARNAA